MKFYEYNLRNRCQTREALEQERRTLQLAIADPCNTDAARQQNIERLAALNRVLEEITQTTLAF